MARTDYVSGAPAVNHVMDQQPQKKPEVDYAVPQHPTNPPIAPPPSQPVTYSEVQQQQNQALVYMQMFVTLVTVQLQFHLLNQKRLCTLM